MARRERPGEGGYSLIELIMAMAIMSVVMVVVTGGIIQIYSATTRADTTAMIREQLSNSFKRLDREIRYATWVGTPGQVGNRWYVEYAMGRNECRQLIYRDGTLLLASWVSSTSSPGTAVKLGTGLALRGSTPPFTLYPVGSVPFASAGPGEAGVGRNYVPEFAQLRFRVNGVAGRTTLEFDVLFTAQNTSRNTSANNDCSAGRPTS